MSAQNPTLTAANAEISLVAVGLLSTPTSLQGFAADNIFSTDVLESAVAVIGVDGNMSGGWKATIKKQNYELQADSPSIVFFDTLWTAQEAIQDIYFLQGTILLPSIGKAYAMSRGILMGYSVIPDGKTMLEPQRFSIWWNSILPAPTN